MTAFEAIRSRLDAGRPVLLGADPRASLRARGLTTDGHAPLGRLVREAPAVVLDFYEHEIAAGIDVISALTAETSPRALGHAGMAVRAAALTGAAMEMANDAADRAPRPIALAGVLTAHWYGPSQIDRIAEECAMHAARLAAADCELLIAYGFAEDDSLPAPPVSMARMGRIAAVVSASATERPTWAVVRVDAPDDAGSGESLPDGVRAVIEAGAEVVLLEVPSAEAGEVALGRADAAAARDAKLGALLAAPARAGELDPAHAAEEWAVAAKRLIEAGARVLGGGPGTTPRHVAALAKALGRVDRSSLWPRAV